MHTHLNIATIEAFLVKSNNTFYEMQVVHHLFRCNSVNLLQRHTAVYYRMATNVTRAPTET